MEFVVSQVPESGPGAPSVHPSEAEEIRGLDEDLAAIVQIVQRPRGDCVVGVAGAVGETVAKRAAEVLQIVVIADIDSRAGMRQPGEEGLGADLLLPQQRRFLGIGQRRVVLRNDSRGHGAGELIVDLGAEGLAFIDQRAAGYRVVAVQQVGVVGGELADRLEGKQHLHAFARSSATGPCPQRGYSSRCRRGWR